MVFLCAIAAIHVVTEKALSSGWPMFCRDISHNARTSDVAPGADSLFWSRSIAPRGWGSDPVIRASPVVSDGRLFVAALSGSLWCFELAEEDSVNWMVDVGTPLSSTPAVSNGKVYVLGGADDRRVHAYYATNGNGAWTSVALGSSSSWTNYSISHRGYWMESSPAVVGDSVLYVGAPDGYLYCIHISESGNTVGSVKWSTPLGDYVRSSPAVSEGRVFVGATGGGDSNKVLALDAADGDTLWYWSGAAGSNYGTLSSPTIVDGALYIGTNWNCSGNWKGAVCKFSCEYDGETAGQPYAAPPPYYFPVYCDVRGTPAVVGDTVYASTGKGLYGLSTSDLSLLLGTSSYVGIQPGGVEEYWSSFAVSVRPNASPPDTLFYIGEGGHLSGTKIWCLNTQLDTVWCYDAGCRVWSSPCVTDGMMLITSDDGDVYCFYAPDYGDGHIANESDAIAGIEVDTRLAIRARFSASAAQCLQVASNPAFGSTSIRCYVPRELAARVRLGIFDAVGRCVRTSPLSIDRTGIANWFWDGCDEAGRLVSGGVYFVRLESAGRQRVVRIVLVR